MWFSELRVNLSFAVTTRSSSVLVGVRNVKARHYYHFVVAVVIVLIMVPIVVDVVYNCMQ